MSNFIKKRLLVLSILVVYLFLSGCATTYPRKLQGHIEALETGNFKKSEEVIDKKLREGDLLYYLEKATVLHYAGEYEESNKYFELAKDLREDLYTKSITKEAVSFITSENVKPYVGEDYESVLIHYYTTLNYLFLGNIEDALVECRQVDLKLRELNDRYEHKNVYSRDALMEYISGVLYESQGDCDDAFISYRNALNTFDDYSRYYRVKLPDLVVRDLLRSARNCGFRDEILYYKSKFPNVEDTLSQDPWSKKGLLLVFFERGWVPYKREGKIEVAIPRGENNVYMVKIAFPYFERVETPPKNLEIVVDKIAQLVTYPMENIEEIAIKNLDDRKERVILKTMARATAKYLLYEEARKKGEKLGESEEEKELMGQIVGGIANIFGYVTERADTRSWLSLPAEIQIQRVFLPEGSYSVLFKLKKNNGTLLKEIEFKDIKIERGKITLLRYRDFER